MVMTNAEWCIKNGYEFSSLYALPSAEGKHGYDIRSMTKKGLLVKLGEVDTVFKNSATAVFLWLDMDHKEPVLDDVERRYLKGVIRPFRDSVKSIGKNKVYGSQKEYLKFYFCGGEETKFPSFTAGTMYKGMNLNRKYTLEELGLDEKGVTIENPECKEDDVEGTNIYGSDYDELADSIRATIKSWAKAHPEACNSADNGKLTVKTPGGTIQAYISSDPDYPGIWLTNTSAPGEPGAVLQYGPLHRSDMVPAMEMRIYEGWNQNSEPEVIRMGAADVICMGAAADEDNY